MNEYRLYFLDKENHVVRREEFQQADDEQAIAHAKQFLDGKALELWSGARLINRLEPK